MDPEIFGLTDDAGVRGVVWPLLPVGPVCPAVGGLVDGAIRLDTVEVGRGVPGVLSRVVGIDGHGERFGGKQIALRVIHVVAAVEQVAAGSIDR